VQESGSFTRLGIDGKWVSVLKGSGTYSPPHPPQTPAASSKSP
jgi:hypothetical protein